MYSLNKLGEKTYYINAHQKIGVYLINEKDICLIDTGLDKSSAKKIEKVILKNNWNIKMIINTHSHSDHIGGNNYLQNKYKCDIYCSKKEQAFIDNPFITASLCYGANPVNDLKNKFLISKESVTKDIAKANLPKGITYVDLKGHSYEMIGIRTEDDVFFIADSIVSEYVLDKYGVIFLYDIDEHLKTLERLKKDKAKYFVPSHHDVCSDISELIKINEEKINDIINLLIDICSKEVTFEEIVKNVFDFYNLEMNMHEYSLVSSTIKSYLSYLEAEKRLGYIIKDNRVLWIRK